MNILGISHPISLNGAACLLKKNKLIAFAEEERFNKIKHSPYLPPIEAIDFCLKEGNITLDQVDYIALGYDSMPNLLRGNILQYTSLFLSRDKISSLLNNQDSNQKKSNAILLTSSMKLLCAYYQGLFRLPFSYNEERVKFIRHHIAHSASAYYVSGFDSACIISADGGGGQEAGMLAVGENESIRILKRIPSKDSLGHLYSLITRMLGFKSHDGEGKVMGLAAYAKQPAKILPFVSFNKDGLAEINQTKMNIYLTNINKKISKNSLDEVNVNLAASVQKTIETAYVLMGEYLYKQTGIRNFCLAGGVSLNCIANTKLFTSGFVDRIFIQPASNDAGTALGAALQVYVNIAGKRPGFVFNHPYYGPCFTNSQIEQIIKDAEIPYYKKINNIEKLAAKLLAKGKIIGWFQGKMEIGPRALGNRSILANPTIAEMKDIINNRIKKREPWRPFAPSILKEHAQNYLVDIADSPFMVLESKVTEKGRKDIIASMHIDGTVRPQTVTKKTNRRYWNLINEFNKITKVPALLNTSFNLSGESIVCTPNDAISTFYRTGIDYLVLEDYIVSKTPFSF